jgi:hypothetical protein
MLPAIHRKRNIQRSMVTQILLFLCPEHTSKVVQCISETPCIVLRYCLVFETYRVRFMTESPVTLTGDVCGFFRSLRWMPRWQQLLLSNFYFFKFKSSHLIIRYNLRRWNNTDKEPKNVSLYSRYVLTLHESCNSGQLHFSLLKSLYFSDRSHRNVLIILQDCYIPFLNVKIIPTFMLNAFHSTRTLSSDIILL